MRKCYNRYYFKLFWTLLITLGLLFSTQGEELPKRWNSINLKYLHLVDPDDIHLEIIKNGEYEIQRLFNGMAFIKLTLQTSNPKVFEVCHAFALSGVERPYQNYVQLIEAAKALNLLIVFEYKKSQWTCPKMNLIIDHTSQ